MAKGSTGRRRIASRSTPYPVTSRDQHNFSEALCPKTCCKGLDKKDFEDVTCSVCMESPHNAVLLLCSSHDNGCRPYMCGTSFKYSNCLDQYKSACTKVTQPRGTTIENPIDVSDSDEQPSENCKLSELACPLCRGQIKGCTVVEPAREFLNMKKRNCMQDNCSFVGSFKELRTHMKVHHPFAQPREVDPTSKQEWARLEREHERNDVISMVRSSTPGSLVFGDYVIEGDTESDEDVEFESSLMNLFFLFSSSGRQSGITISRDNNLSDYLPLFTGQHFRHRFSAANLNGRRSRTEADDIQMD